MWVTLCVHTPGQDGGNNCSAIACACKTLLLLYSRLQVAIVLYFVQILWVSVSSDLRIDAVRDLTDVDGPDDGIVVHPKVHSHCGLFIRKLCWRSSREVHSRLMTAASYV